MREFIKRNTTRIAVVAVSLLIASTCAVSGTLAALSADYSWSDSMKAGSFDYADLSKSFDLFGDNDVFPGDFGSAVLETVDFGSNSVSWSFSETNADFMPVIFYTLNDGIPAGVYSKYDYGTNLTDYYVGLQTDSGSAYVQCCAVSNDASSIAAELDFGKTLYWSWPSRICSDTSGTMATGASVTEYDEFSSALCIDTYGITAQTLSALNGTLTSDMKPTYYANGYNGGFETLELETVVNADNGLLQLDNTYVKAYDGENFKDITEESELVVNDFYVAFILEAAIEDYINQLTAAGITNITRLDNNLYKRSATTGIMSEDETGNRAAVKIAPSKINEKATISVTVTATVSQA